MSPGGGRSRRARPPRRSRAASPASASEFGSVLRRCANDASTTRLIRSKSLGQRHAAERDERRVDVRRRPEDGTRDGMEAGPLGGELDQHRNGPVRLRRGLGEEAVGDLPLHHHAPELEAGQAGRGSRRRSASRCCRGGSRRAWSAPARARRGRAEARRPSAARRSGAPPALARCGASERSSSTAWTWCDTFREVAVRTPRPGPISSTTSSRPSSASRPITPRMFSSARKCWPSCFFGTDAHGEAEGGASRSRRSRARARPASSPRAAASAATRVDDVRGLVRAAAQRLRREVGAVRLGEDPIGGNGGRGLAQLLGLRIRRRCRRTRSTSPARAPAASSSGSEKQCMTTVPSCAPSIAPVSSFAARVWTTTGRPSSCASPSCASNRRPLFLAPVGPVVVVEPGLADGHGLRVSRVSSRSSPTRYASRRPPGAGRSRARRRHRRARRRWRARRGTTRCPSRS